MKTAILILTLMILSDHASAQKIPLFLEGTWKVENQELYEHWQQREDGSLEGYSYRYNEGEKVVTENLEVRQSGTQVIYTATVLDQNEGKGIDFKLHQPDSITWSFENLKHDFPKKIVYQKRSDTELWVQVSDGADKGFSYLMQRIENN